MADDEALRVWGLDRVRDLPVRWSHGDLQDVLRSRLLPLLVLLPPVGVRMALQHVGVCGVQTASGNPTLDPGHHNGWEDGTLGGGAELGSSMVRGGPSR